MSTQRCPEAQRGASACPHRTHEERLRHETRRVTKSPNLTSTIATSGWCIGRSARSMPTFAGHPVVRWARRCPRLGERYALHNARLRSRRASFRAGRGSLEGDRTSIPVRRNAVRIPRASRDSRRHALRAPSAFLAPPLARRRLRRDTRRNRSDAVRAHDRCSTNGEGSPASSSGIVPRSESDDTRAS
jgi:hypothetical protein